jgi:hypothetical protein
VSTTTERPEPRTALLGGETKHRGLLGSRPPAQLAVLGAAGLLALLVIYLVRSLVGVALGVVIFALPYALISKRRGTDGATWFSWLPEEIRYRTEVRTGRHRFDPHAEPGLSPPEAGRVSFVSYTLPGGGPLAVAIHRNPGEPAYCSAVLEIIGDGDGIREEAEYNRLARRFGLFLYGLSKSSYLACQVDLLSRTLPNDPYAYDRYLTARMPADLPPALRASQLELAELTRHTAEQHRTFLIVRIPLDRQLAAQAALKGGGDAGLCRAVLDELQAVAALAEANSLRVRWALGPRRLAALIRNTYDPDQALDDLTDAELSACWPAYVNHREYLVVDDRWYHAVAVVPADAWPTTPVGIRFLDPLLTGVSPATIRTLAVSFPLVPRVIARSEAVADHTLDRAAALAVERKGRITDGAEDAQVTASSQRLHDLRHEEAAGVRPWMRLLVSARSPRELAAARKRLEDVAQDCGLAHLEWVHTRHHHGLLTCLPLARGVRP